MDFDLSYAFVCEDVRQEIGGKVSFMGQLDVLRVKKTPVLVPKLCIVYAGLGTPGTYKVRAVIKREGTAKGFISVPEHQVEIKSKEHKIREIYQLNNLKFDKPGKYQVLIEYDGKLLVKCHFVVADTSMPKSGGSTFDFPINLSQN